MKKMTNEEKIADLEETIDFLQGMNKQLTHEVVSVCMLLDRMGYLFQVPQDVINTYDRELHELAERSEDRLNFDKNNKRKK